MAGKSPSYYALSGILLGSIGGWVLGKLRLESWLSEWVHKLLQQSNEEATGFEAERTSFFHRLPAISKGALDIVKGVVLYVIIGIGIGAAMHGYVPDAFFQERLSGGEWWTVPVAVVLAVPIYANAAGIVPVIQVLVAKGVPLGTAIAFMMGTVGLSLPEATLLKKVMSARMIAVFFGVVTLFIILSGFMFNILL
ncbi:MAG: permease [Owenweeksia sp.]|nr:permease [Owenweeksia sp.]